MCQSSIVFVIIRFSATNWQEWCCCECKRLSIWAALNYHTESLKTIYLHITMIMIANCGDAVFYKCCKGNVFHVWYGIKNTCSLSSTSTELWNISHKLQKCLCWTNTGQMNKMHRLLNNFSTNSVPVIRNALNNCTIHSKSIKGTSWNKISF